MTEQLRRRPRKAGVLGRAARMKDVAAYAGVSEATVSRVFSSPERVSNRARARVLDAAAELNYTLNSVAQTLAGSAAKVVLVLLPDIGAPYFSQLLRGIERRARELSYCILVGELGPDSERVKTYVDHVFARRADGIIFAGGYELPAIEILAEVKRRSRKNGGTIPFVNIGTRSASVNAPTITVDNFGAAKEAVNYLIGLGHRRIGFLGLEIDSPEGERRLAGYLAALADAGIESDDRYITRQFANTLGGRKAVASLFDAGIKDLTAFFAANDDLAIGAMGELRERGLAVPDDVSVVGFDDTPLASVVAPTLTTVHQPAFDMGWEAMSMIVKQIAGESIRKKTVVMPSHLVVRQSTRKFP